MDKVIDKNLVIDECIISLSNGENDAMDTLYAIIKDDIYAYALSKVRNKFDADDIMQETFLKIYENAKLYKPMGKGLAWIFTIETNVINRYFQIKSRKQLVDDETIFDSISDNESSSFEKFVQNEYLKNLFCILDNDEIEVISLHIVSDLKFREIAKVLGKPLSTVLSKYNRAIKKIKKIAKEEK